MQFVGKRAAAAAISGSNTSSVQLTQLSTSFPFLLSKHQQQHRQRRPFHDHTPDHWSMATPLTMINTKENIVPAPVLINPPIRLMRPMHFPDRLLLGPGPSNMTEDIRSALAAPLLGHLHPEFLEIMDDVKAGLQYAFQTENSLTFAISGTGHAGMECAMLNLLEPGETILVLQNGVWGQRAADLGRRMNLDVKLLHVGEGQVIHMEDFVEAVETFKPAVAFLCHGESSTGVVHPLDGFGEVCRKNGALLLVDTVASLGAAPFHADELMVDCVYSATQKALAKMRFRKSRVPSFYFDALEIGNYWGCFTNEARRYHHTAPISLVYALQHRLPCLTTVKVPKGVDWKQVQGELMTKGIEIAGGLGPLWARFGELELLTALGGDAAVEERAEEHQQEEQQLKTASNI
uniref:Aminotransferase class V domain-containing protein n=1 Tax=Ditylenchus dipsaci TaxID=166011 RepID=A0A915CMS0_9BILA